MGRECDAAPAEVLVCIFEFLAPEGVAAGAALVCRRWRAVFLDPRNFRRCGWRCDCCRGRFSSALRPWTTRLERSFPGWPLRICRGCRHPHRMPHSFTGYYTRPWASLTRKDFVTASVLARPWTHLRTTCLLQLPADPDRRALAVAFLEEVVHLARWGSSLLCAHARSPVRLSTTGLYAFDRVATSTLYLRCVMCAEIDSENV